MIKSRLLTFVFALIVTFGFAGSQAGVVEGPTCIVIPTRYTIVQFSFDLMRLRRDIYLVAHDKEIGGDATVLHVWDDKTQDWVRVGVEEYVAGTVFTALPKRLIVVGGQNDLPEELASAPSWVSEAYQIESLDLVQILNRLQTVFRFNEREWQWLAKRYNITFEDLNAERRRYGKYGKPGEENQASMPGAVREEKLEPVPAGPIEIITAPEPELVVEEPVDEVVVVVVEPEQPAVEVEVKKGDIAPEDK